MNNEPSQVKRFLELGAREETKTDEASTGLLAEKTPTPKAGEGESPTSIMARQMTDKIKAGTVSNTDGTEDTTETVAPAETEDTPEKTEEAAPDAGEETAVTDEGASDVGTLELDESHIIDEGQPEAAIETKKSAFKPSAAVEDALRKRQDEVEALSAESLANGDYLPRTSMHLAQGSSYEDINAMITRGHLRLGIDEDRPAVFITKERLRELAHEKATVVLMLEERVQAILEEQEELKARLSKASNELVREEAKIKMINELSE